MEIVKYPDPILLRPSKEVPINKELRQFIQDMLVFMQNLPWGNPVGLAAPQVGKNIRLFIALDNVYINPILTPVKKDGLTEHEEGCYSLEKNKFDYKIKRYNTIMLKWQDKKARFHSQKFTGFPAQVIQHEYDHIEGRLCCGSA